MSKNTQKTKIDGDNTGDIAGGDINKGNNTSFHLKLPALVRLSLLVASGTVVVKMGWVNTIIQNFQNNNPSTTYSSPSPNSKAPSVAVPSNSSIPKQTSPINVTLNVIEGQKVARIESIVGKIDGKIPPARGNISFKNGFWCTPPPMDKVRFGHDDSTIFIRRIHRKKRHF